MCRNEATNGRRRTKSLKSLGAKVAWGQSGLGPKWVGAKSLAWPMERVGRERSAAAGALAADNLTETCFDQDLL